jgi:hypothetical protein
MMTQKMLRSLLGNLETMRVLVRFPGFEGAVRALDRQVTLRQKRSTGSRILPVLQVSVVGKRLWERLTVAVRALTPATGAVSRIVFHIENARFSDLHVRNGYFEARLVYGTLTWTKG